MSADVMWVLDPHTRAKHDLLNRYLEVWFPILGTYYGDLVLCDGFAGPGQYKGGERGSPLIMLNAAREYCQRSPGRKVHCFLIEKEAARFRHMRDLVQDLGLPPSVIPYPIHGEFVDETEPLVRSIATYEASGPVPSFFLIDPFGIKGAPMAFISRLMSLEKSECLFSFMWEPIRRFAEHGAWEMHMDDLFGTDGWRDILADDTDDHRAKLHALFERRLRESGATYVLPFQLWEGGKHIYTLFFATNGIKGCDVMKQTMWSIDPTGSYAFRGTLQGQRPLDFSVEPSGLEEDLRRHFGREWISTTEADDFMKGDQTLYLKQHLRKRTLVPLEEKGIIEVDRPDGERRGSFGDGVRFRFCESVTPAVDSQPALL